MEVVLKSTHNLCFEQKYETYQSFLSEFFQILEVKFSIYFNRHVLILEIRKFLKIKVHIVCLCWFYGPVNTLGLC